MSKDPKKDILWRIYLLYIGMFVFGLAIVGRIAYIQWAEGDMWIEKSKEQSVKYFKIEAIRGNIYSDDNSLLATSIPIYDLFWDATVLRDAQKWSNKFKVTEQQFRLMADTLSRQMAKLYPDLNREDFKQKVISAYNKKKKYLPVKKKVDFAKLKEIKQMCIFNRGQYKGGLIINKSDRRVRPHKDLAMRTIGIYHQDMKKYVIGLEGGFDKYLKGKDGIRVKQKIAGGWKPVFLLDETVKEPVNGYDIVTSLNINLQDVAQDALYRHLAVHDAEWGCAILMEVKTGYIKAITNLSKDTTNPRGYAESLNHAIGTSVEPGSTMKLASLLVALNDEKCKLDDIVHTGNGVFTYYGSTMKDSHDGGYGDITVQQVLEKSSNVGTMKVILKAYQDNPSDFIDGLYRMNLNQKLGLEIKGEGKPYVKNTKDKTWWKTSLPWMSVGYEIQFTPLQILTFYNAVANGGKMVKPLFINSIQNTGQIIKEIKPEIINDQIASAEAIKCAQTMLEGVVIRGTAAESFKHSPYKVAGKTGTAQISMGGYNKSNYRASFVGYFPADNPRYSCIVVVNNPSKGQYYASQVAVPVFKEIADKIYATELDLQPNEPDTVIYSFPTSKVGQIDDIKAVYKMLGFSSDSLDANVNWLAGISNNGKLGFSYRNIDSKYVPNVLNMNAKDAIYLLEQKGLFVSIIGKGKIVSQSIPAGSTLVKGQRIQLTLDN